MSVPPPLGPIHEVLHLNTRLFLNCLEGLSDAAAVRKPAPDANSAVAVALHLVDSRCYFASQAGAVFEHPLPALRTAGSVDKLEKLPSLEEIRTAWSGISGVLAARIAALTAEDLQKPGAGRFPVADRSLLGTLAFAVQHESSHIGQLGYIRRLLGLPAMRYR